MIYRVSESTKVGGATGRDPSEGAIVTTPGAADSTAIHRGKIALATALRLSTLLPREQDAIFSILRSLNSADELLRRQYDNLASDAFAASMLESMLDTYRRELANLGR